MWYVRVDPKQCFNSLFVAPHVRCNLRYAFFALLSSHFNLRLGPSENHVITGAWVTRTCSRISHPGLHCSECFRRWNSLLWANWAYLGHTLPASKSLEFLALSLLVLHRPYADNQQIIGIHCSGHIVPTSGLAWQPRNHWNPLLWVYWAYLGHILTTSRSLESIALGLLCLPRACLDNQQLIGIHCSGPVGPTSGIPWQPAYSVGTFGNHAFALLFISFHCFSLRASCCYCV